MTSDITSARTMHSDGKPPLLLASASDDLGRAGQTSDSHNHGTPTSWDSHKLGLPQTKLSGKLQLDAFYRTLFRLHAEEEEARGVFPNFPNFPSFFATGVLL